MSASGAQIQKRPLSGHPPINDGAAEKRPRDGAAVAGAGSGGKGTKRGATLEAALSPPLVASARITALRAEFDRSTPFPHLRVPGVFDADLLAHARSELDSGALEWTQRNNDLFRFSQSDSLDKCAPPDSALARVCAGLYAPSFRAWVTAVTGVGELDETLDISAARYTRGDHLLCHDDDLSGRAVAFILYLTPDAWEPAHGGALDLFASDAGGAPTRVVTRCAASFNSLTLFAVSPRSFHAVQEILSDAAGPRFSISGWWHSRALPARAPSSFKAPVRTLAPVSRSPAVIGQGDAACSETLSQWISSTYRQQKTLADAATAFSDAQGALELTDFLLPSAFDAVARALCVQTWRACGPPIVASYRISHETGRQTDAPGAAPDALARLWALFTSSLFRDYLRAVTAGCGLTVGERVAGVVAAYAPGDYSLITDTEFLAKRKAEKLARRVGDKAVSKKARATGASKGAGEDNDRDIAVLDVTLCIVRREWDERVGGTMTYLTADEEVTSVVPRGNALSIILRPPGVFRFTKYVSSDSPETLFRVEMSFEVE